MINKFLIATKNQGKIKEISFSLADQSLNFTDLSNSDIEEPAETGKTFEENALLKARYYHQKTGLCTLADDSGLEIDALEGFPGVNTADWAKRKDVFEIFEQMIKEKNSNNFKAKFVCVLCYLTDESNYKFFKAEVLGKLTFPPRGRNGFGFDPIFIAQGQTRTLAELDISKKNQISARAKSIKLFASYLKQISTLKT